MSSFRNPLVALLVLAPSACRKDEPEASGTTGTATSASTAPPLDSPVADSTGGAFDPCIDDYHGNQEPQTAVDLALDTTDTARIALGDGVAATPAEIGGDRLAVCEGARFGVG